MDILSLTPEQVIDWVKRNTLQPNWTYAEKLISQGVSVGAGVLAGSLENILTPDYAGAGDVVSDKPGVCYFGNLVLYLEVQSTGDKKYSIQVDMRGPDNSTDSGRDNMIRFYDNGFTAYAQPANCPWPLGNGGIEIIEFKNPVLIQQINLTTESDAAAVDATQVLLRSTFVGWRIKK